MCIYCNTTNYRSIYKEHHGLIPVDEEGRSFQVHHVDFNHNNHDPNNLIAISLREHYNIHFANKDYSACNLMSKELNLSPEERSQLATFENLKRVANGNHPFTSEFMTEENKKRYKEGKHPSLTEKFRKETRERELKRVKDGSHQFISNNPSHIKLFCIHCKQNKASNTFKKYHGDNCKLNPNRLDHNFY